MSLPPPLSRPSSDDHSRSEADPPPDDHSRSEADPPPDDHSSDDEDGIADGIVDGNVSLTWVSSLTSSLASFESAIVKMKDKSRVGSLQIYGEIKLVTRWGHPPYLYRRRTEADADNISYSVSDEGFILPLSFPDWSLNDTDIYSCEVELYEKGGGGTPFISGSFCLFSSGSDRAVPDWNNKIHKPISLVIDNERAKFTLCATRISHSINACFIFRVLHRHDDSDYKGKLWSYGTITATQTFSNGVSRRLTLFKSSSGVEVPAERPYPEIPLIPLPRPIVVFPVQREEQVRDGGGPFLTVEFDLKLKEFGSDQMKHVVQGTKDFHLKYDHGLGYPFFSSLDCIESDQCGDNRLKIEIIVIPFHQFFHNDPNHIQMLLKWGVDNSQTFI